MHPSYLSENHLSIKVKIFHSITGHIYVRPINNLKPFSYDDEKIISEELEKLGIHTCKSFVKSNFTTKPIETGYGFRLY